VELIISWRREQKHSDALVVEGTLLIIIGGIVFMHLK